MHADPDNPQYGYKILAYETSQTAQISFAVHLADGQPDTVIKVNSVHPGTMRTELGGEDATGEHPMVDALR